MRFRYVVRALDLDTGRTFDYLAFEDHAEAMATILAMRAKRRPGDRLVHGIVRRMVS